jgi:flagellar M-ring protein FliF
VAQLLTNLKEIWQRMSLARRVMLLAMLLACGGAAALLVNWARQPTMGLLYSRLSPEEAAKIVEKVRDEGAPYQLKEGGTAVYVPQDRVYALRLSLASQGLPAGQQEGYRILDQTQIGVSPFFQRVNYYRAVEGELSKTVQTLDGVVSARVHVVRPENTLFAPEDKQASASVVLKLKQGHRLTSANVAAIVHLISGAVEGLRPERVVVVDSNNNLLSGEADNELAKKAGTFLDYKAQVEQYMAEKAEEMLAAALGPNRVSIRVDATIDTTSIEQTVETYDPTNRVVAKEDMKTKSSAPASPAGGEPNAKVGNTEKEETTTTEYLASLTRKRQMDLPGKVTAVTVAALVDLSPPPAPQGAAGAAPATTITKEAVRDIIQKALGLPDPNSITVQETSFYRPVAATAGAAAEEGLFTKDFLLEIARRASLGVLVIGALLALKIFGGGSGKKLPAASTPALTAEGAQPAGLLTAPQGADARLLRTRITNALQENPEEVKRLFLNWVDSERGET